MDESRLRGQLEQHHAASYGWALSCCAHNPEEAADVLQSAYLKILQGRARFLAGGAHLPDAQGSGGNNQASFKTWLFAVIRRTAAEARRRHWLRRKLLERFAHEQEPAELPPGADQASERGELWKLLRAALERLPGRQREVLHLAFYQDLSLAEAAGVMGVTVGTARTHYERGKAGLRELFKQSGYFNEHQ
ncbi:MAG: RNA polymerase sigma factor [Lentisphaerae bacterium]|nr:RNA polymerase sigma factor [Lentisphaerota bacterium]